MDILVILSRWAHVMAAVLAIGGAVFMRFVLPLGLAEADAGSREAVYLRCRRAFKMIIHGCVAVLLISGAFNTWMNWDVYTKRMPPGLGHGLWGGHVVLGLMVIGVSLWLTAGPKPPAPHKAVLAANVVAMLVLVAVASGLKYARDRAMKQAADRAVPAAVGTPGAGGAAGSTPAPGGSAQ